MYANKLGKLMRKIISSLFVMLTKMDNFKLTITLLIAQKLHNKKWMNRKRFQIRGMITIQE